MPGPPPKDDAVRRRRNAPVHGWHDAPGVGWQHGEVPAAPAKLTRAARDAWGTWFGAWFAAFWTPGDVPGLTQMVRLYDQVQRGDMTRASEARLWMDTYGVTPKGQQQRRWRPPASEAAPSSQPASRYRRLRAVPPS